MSNEAPNVMVKCDLFWPNLTHPNKLDSRGRYTVDLANLSDAAVTAMEDMGIPVNNKGDERGSYVTCKSINKYRAYRSDGSEWLIKGRTPRDEEDDPESGVIVGNGSKAKCLVGYYDWEYLKKKGRSATLKRLVIDEVVEYQAEVEEMDAL
jgi:hypothetical protein